MCLCVFVWVCASVCSRGFRTIVLRYQRHINSLWTTGILLGFINRQDVNNALYGHEPGTFLIRFSERHAGWAA